MSESVATTTVLWIWTSPEAPASWHFLTIDGEAGDAIRATALMRSGKDVINLGIGQIGLHHFFTRLCRGHGTNVAQAQHLAVPQRAGAVVLLAHQPAVGRHARRCLASKHGAQWRERGAGAGRPGPTQRQPGDNDPARQHRQQVIEFGAGRGIERLPFRGARSERAQVNEPRGFVGGVAGEGDKAVG